MIRQNDLPLKEAFIYQSGINDLFSCNVSGMLELMLFNRNEDVLVEGQASDYLYFLVQGELKIYSSLGNGSLFAHGFLPEFRVLGEMSCLWGDVATATARCVSECYLFAIPLQQYRETIINDVKFLQYLCRIMRDELASMTEKSRSHLFPLESRFASLLIDNNDKGVLRYSLTACSELLAVSYRHLLRIVTDFVNRGLIEKHGTRGYRIVQWQPLYELAHSNPERKSI